MVEWEGEEGEVGGIKQRRNEAGKKKRENIQMEDWKEVGCVLNGGYFRMVKYSR